MNNCTNLSTEQPIKITITCRCGNKIEYAGKYYRGRICNKCNEVIDMTSEDVEFMLKTLGVIKPYNGNYTYT